MIASVKPVNAESNIIILSETSYISASDAYYIVGEVKNTGETPVRFVKITATYYDSNNDLIVTDWGYAELDVLLPNTKSGFTVVLLSDAAELEKIDHYTLAVTYSDAPTVPEQTLYILSHDSYISNTGALHITGEIQNTGTKTSTYTIIYATFYDSNGKVVGTDLTFPEPEDMPAGTTESFDVLCVDYDRVPMMTSYTLTAESDQYAITTDVSGTITAPETTTTPTTISEATPTPTVPEYPVATALIAIVIATFCALLFLKGKREQKQ
jgi:hypothetical protein